MLTQAFIIGACAWVATGILFQPDYPLEWWWNLLSVTRNRLPNWWKWIVKPFGHCGQCFAGQVGFWYFFFSRQLFHLFVTFVSPVRHLFELISFALLTIFFWSVFNGVDTLYKKQNA